MLLNYRTLDGGGDDNDLNGEINKGPHAHPRSSAGCSGLLAKKSRMGGEMR